MINTNKIIKQRAMSRKLALKAYHDIWNRVCVRINYCIDMKTRDCYFEIPAVIVNPSMNHYCPDECKDYILKKISKTQDVKFNVQVLEQNVLFISW